MSPKAEAEKDTNGMAHSGRQMTTGSMGTSLDTENSRRVLEVQEQTLVIQRDGGQIAPE